MSRTGAGGASTSGSLALVVQRNAVALISCLFYSFCSITMVLGNKLLMTGEIGTVGKGAPFSLLMFQSAIVAVILLVGRALGLFSFEPFDCAVAVRWLPLNVLFILMLMTGLMALGWVAVPMVTVFKNLTNILTVAGDRYFFGQPVSTGIVMSLVLMLCGASLAAVHDLTFNARGYLWMAANCVSTSAYVLSLRWRTTDESLKLSKTGMVFYNNLLAVCTGAPFAILRGEVGFLLQPAQTTLITGAAFLSPACFIACVGACLNFATYWCVGTTSATTYATVGALNKVPLIILGVVLFDTPLTSKQMIFVAFSTAGGFVYSYVKFRESQAQRKQHRSDVSLVDLERTSSSSSVSSVARARESGGARGRTSSMDADSERQPLRQRSPSGSGSVELSAA